MLSTQGYVTGPGSCLDIHTEMAPRVAPTPEHGPRCHPLQPARCICYMLGHADPRGSWVLYETLGNLSDDLSSEVEFCCQISAARATLHKHCHLFSEGAGQLSTQMLQTVGKLPRVSQPSSPSTKQKSSEHVSFCGGVRTSHNSTCNTLGPQNIWCELSVNVITFIIYANSTGPQSCFQFVYAHIGGFSRVPIIWLALNFCLP